MTKRACYTNNNSPRSSFSCAASNRTRNKSKTKRMSLPHMSAYHPQKRCKPSKQARTFRNHRMMNNSPMSKRRSKACGHMKQRKMGNSCTHRQKEQQHSRWRQKRKTQTKESKNHHRKRRVKNHKENKKQLHGTQRSRKERKRSTRRKHIMYRKCSSHVHHTLKILSQSLQYCSQ